MSDLTPYVLGFVVAPFLLPLLMPGPRSLIVCVAIFGGALAIFWTWHAWARGRPNYEEGAGAALGNLALLVLTVTFIVGVLLRAGVGAYVRHRRRLARSS